MISKSQSPPTGTKLLREIQEATDDLARYKDTCLTFVRRKTGDRIFRVGGRWDYLTRSYSGAAAHHVPIKLEESQVEFATWFGEWLDSYQNNEPRDTRLVLTAGERRGGKTTVGLLAVIATAIAVPGTIAWAVSSTYQERDELEQTILKFIPAHWYRYRGAPKYRFAFPNGSVLRNVSADDPETLKQGRVDVVLVNEAQKMHSNVISNILPGAIDRGGLVILAANPPRRAVGEWVRDLKEAVDANRVKATKFFGFSAKLNEQIDQKAREDVGDILRVIDPKTAMADDEGLWLPVGDVAYHKFSVNEHIKPIPQLGDITRSVLKARAGREYDRICGVDFQATPYHAGVSLRVFRGADGRNIYWAESEIIREGTEHDFLDNVEEAGYQPEDTVWIGDASGTWQDGAHKRGRASFDIFRSRRWHIHPPRKAKDESKRPSNPPVEDRVNLVNRLLSEGRLFISPQARTLCLAIKKCEFKHGKPYGKFAHVTDALGYVLYYLEPKPAPTKRGPGAWNISLQRGNGF